MKTKNNMILIEPQKLLSLPTNIKMDFAFLSQFGAPLKFPPAERQGAATSIASNLELLAVASRDNLRWFCGAKKWLRKEV